MPLFKIGGSEPIDCPRCDIALAEERFARFGPDVIIDVCPACAGTWYDKGEISKVLDDVGLQTRLVNFPQSGEPSPLSCPRCGGAMRVHKEGSVEVDSCTSCSGVWLDMGEEEGLRAKLAWEAHAETARAGQDAALYTLMSGRTI
ncbi:MAG: zf-TFIIB domain-containing protein [Thermoplasmata archaeon]|nr:MAG: zf-TFIIB domain-containing protein [Thermoplasmata archaeon]